MKRILSATAIIFSTLLLMNFVDDNWIELFNGENFDGWHKLSGTAEFKIEDGIIVGVSKVNSENTFLATDKEYGDFILEYEIKVEPGLNSGVQIRSLHDPEYKNGRVQGYQVEAETSTRAWSGGVYDEARRGWLYHLEYNPGAKTAYTINVWNKYRVEAIGNNIRVWVNGIETTNLIDDLTPKGIIALQVHNISDEALNGKTAQFRNIRIMTDDLGNYATPQKNEIPQVSFLNNQLTDKEVADGWKLLWDGKTTKGWRGAKSDQFPEFGWKIDDGVLSVEPSGGSESANGGDIVTIEKYGNFILELDFNFTEGANSGIKYFVDSGLNKGAGSAIGCEYQILDDQKHPDAKLGVSGNRTLASLYDLIAANSELYVTKENVTTNIHPGNWYRARIVSQNGKVEHYLGGIKVIEYERGTQMWRSLVAYSKYKDWPNFGELPEGNILLQDHGDEVSFRNVKIKILK